MPPPHPDAPDGERGFTLVLVLLAGGLLTLLALLFLQYGSWSRHLRGSTWNLYKQHQALRLAERQTKRKLRRILADTGYLTRPLRQRWELPPDVSIETRSVALNGRFNLNLLNRPGLSESYRTLLERLLGRMGYPARAADELIRWIEPAGELDAGGVDRYAGYPYGAPGRPFRHLDELPLVSGFIQRGVPPPLRRMITVHGSGNINVHHLTPAVWRLLASAAGERVPAVPPTALRSSGALSEYLTRPTRWRALRRQFGFLTRRDDAVRTRFSLRSGGSSALHVEAVYERRPGSSKLTTATRYSLHESWDGGSSAPPEST